MDRRQPRQLVDRPAKIYVAGSDPLPCRVRDISRGGAKLYVFWKGWLPDTFDLADVFAKTRREVRVVWVGVSGVGFVSSTRAARRSSRSRPPLGAVDDLLSFFDVWELIIGPRRLGHT